MPLQLRRGTNAQRLGYTPLVGELIYTTDTKSVYVGDGTTPGGIAITSLAAGLVGNLAGNINLNTFAINGIGTVDIIGNISATGNIIGNHTGSFFADDSTTVIDGPTGTVVGPISNSISNVRLTGGTVGQVITTDGNGNLSFTTISGGGGGGSGTVNSGNVSNLAYYASTGTAVSENTSLSWNNGTSTFSIAGNLNATGTISSSISNLKISGGTAGQVVTTDGSGNLTFTNNGNGTINYGSITNLAYYASSGTTISENTALSWNNSLSIFVVNGNSYIDGDLTVNGLISGPISNLRIGGGTAGQVIATDGSGNLSFTSVGSGSGTVSSGGANKLAYYSSAGTTVSSLTELSWDSSTTTLNLSGRLLSTTVQTTATYSDRVLANFISPKNRGTLFEKITFGDPTNKLRNVVFDFSLSDATPFEIKALAVPEGDPSIPKIQFTAFGTSTITANCTQLLPGDNLSAIVQAIQNPVSSGGALLISSGLVYELDPNGIVTPGYASGKFYFFNRNGPDPINNRVILSFDSKGFLGINKLTATEALDVDGNGLFTGTVDAGGFVGSVYADGSTMVIDRITGSVTGSTVTSNGYVMFGSYTSTQRSGLTAANGMVIYNSTTNRFQGYQNGGWINLDDGTAAP